MKRIIFVLALLIASFVRLHATEATLKCGDMAPKLFFGEWIQGEPVHEFETNKVYLIDFWATWCGPCVRWVPHLNKLQEKYKDKGLVIIGQAVDNDDQKKVKPFCKKMGDKMAYRVVLDDYSHSKKGVMTETWYRAAGQHSIPSAILVGKNGRIVWIGDPRFLKESVIEAALAAEPSSITDNKK